MEEKMNQILQVQEKRNNRNQPIDTKKVVLFFAVCILLFGLILVGQGAYHIYEAKKNQKVTPPNPSKIEEYTPSITLSKLEDNKVMIQVESQVAISHLLYHWNNESATTLEEDGKTTIQEIISIPVGENTLHIVVIDQNGKETKQSETYNIDVTKPVIELSVVGNNIKVTVTSETDLAYVTYKWNSEEEKREEMTTYENKTTFEKSLEIPKGQNTLKITAVDSNGNNTEKSQEIRGVTKAKTTTLAKGEYLTFTIVGEDNIEKVEYEWNGKRYNMDKNTFGETNRVYYRIKMVEGWNYLKITSTTINGAQDTSFWKYEYKKAQ